MRNLLLFLSIGVFSQCSTIERIASNTYSSNEYLDRIEKNTARDTTSPTPNPLDTLDVFYPRLGFKDLFSENVIQDTSFALSENWFQFEVVTRPTPGGQITRSYNGYVHAANPDLLFVRSISEDSTATTSMIEMRDDERIKVVEGKLLNESSAELNQVTIPQKELLFTPVEWQKQLVSGSGVFDGFKLLSREFTYIDLSRYSFNHARLEKNTFYYSYANSADQLELPSNTMFKTFFIDSQIAGLSMRNWHVTSDDLLTRDYWINTTITNADLNDIVIRNIGWNLVTCNNCIIRNTNYGYLRSWKLSKSRIMNSLLENAKLQNSEFYGTEFAATRIMNTTFDKVKFSGAAGTRSKFYLMPYIQGDFLNTSFEWGVDIIQSNILSSNFKGGSFNQVIFSQESYIKDVKFVGTTFMDVKFNDTGLWNVQFGDPNASGKSLVTRCDFRAAKFGENVKFINVNLIGSTFPPRADLDRWGVQFIGCENEPTQ